ncbi:Vacuolar inheritance and morphology protein [Friedmanniomyces endolithicus]|nr:Vacuolar inheritance and morphology protein [Friedmanniomyces endolithicus]
MANNYTTDPKTMSGKMETAEPSGGSLRRSPSQQRQALLSQSSTTTTPPLRKQRSSNLVPFASPTAGTSPHTSRTTSPIRRDSRPQPLSNPSSTQPSAAAIQRALSAANIPHRNSIGPVTDAVSRLPRATRGAEGGSGDTTPQWPVSPRLKSPPPSGATSRRGSTPAQQRSVDTVIAPSINVQSATPQSSTPPAKPGGEEVKRVEQQLQPPPKAASSSRGPSGKSILETVQENSADTISASPAAVQAVADLKPLTKITEEDKTAATKREGPEPEKHTQPGESGSESAGSKLDRTRGRKQSLTQPKVNPRPANPVKSSYTPLQSAKSRQQSEGKHNMTVETETVQSIPQSALNAGDRTGSGRNDPSGSIRLKPSNETIRPKKERKKPTQKARSINQGTGMYRSSLLVHRESFEDARDDTTVVSSSGSSSVEEEARKKRGASYARRWQRMMSFALHKSYDRTFSNKRLRKASSKADIFEARVASAVEQENTSDSDETFVYESNPPEPQRRPRHHSRTPSVTSSHSMTDQQRGGIRNFGDMMDEQQRKVAGKRSMKFSNNPYNDVNSPDSKNGTVRSHQARHFGKFGRGGSHASSMYEPESPFTQASKLRSGHLNTRQSRPNSPRSPQSIQQQQQHRPSGLFSGRKTEQWDFDGEGADDERTPLVGTVRTPRGVARHRRLESGDTVQTIDEYYGVRREPRFGRFGGCLLGLCVLTAVILSAVAFLVMSNRPMYDVRICKIENVLASEQEIMLDLFVGAVNPNALSITVMDVDLNVFAKSRHAGSDLNASAHDTSQRTARRRRKTELSAEEKAPAKAGNPNPWQDMSGHWHAPSGGVDRGTDPDPPNDDDDNDQEKDAQTMLLGRILHFDQALAFEGSPIKRHAHFSLGELRLMRPGNRTEVGGSERWERTLLHPFELVVRGVLKYQLPVSGREQSVSVGASVVVHPEEGVDAGGRMRVEAVSRGGEWRGVGWEEDIDEEGGKREVVEVEVG